MHGVGGTLWLRIDRTQSSLCLDVARKWQVCYRMGMSRKNKNGSGRHRPTPVLIFCMTLGGVVLAGLAVLLVVAAFRKINSDAKNKYEAAQSSIFKEKTEVIHTDSASGGEAEITSELLQDNPRYGSVLSDEEYMVRNRIHAWEAASEDEVTLCFTGDILFDDEYAVMATLLNRGGDLRNGISEELLSMMKEADITVVNNEFPYTDRGNPTEGKAFTFRADTDTVAYLYEMGADVAVIANNHVYDYGQQGLLDTLDTLENTSVHAIGAGRNIEEASSPVYFIVNDRKIALIAATQIERLDNPDTHGATEDSAGVFRCWNPEKLCEAVAQAKSESDFVIVCMHWGTENENEPDWAQEEQAPMLAEAGADLIVGDHPHCLQGITYYGDTPVFYSLGNFWFNSKTVDTGLLRVTLDAEGIRSMQFVPAIQSDCRVNMVHDGEKERILSLLRTLSPGVRIDADGMISR